jgi:hypothetical protein
MDPLRKRGFLPVCNDCHNGNTGEELNEKLLELSDDYALKYLELVCSQVARAMVMLRGILQGSDRIGSDEIYDINQTIKVLSGIKSSGLDVYRRRIEWENNDD